MVPAITRPNDRFPTPARPAEAKRDFYSKKAALGNLLVDNIWCRHASRDKFGKRGSNSPPGNSRNVPVASYSTMTYGRPCVMQFASSGRRTGQSRPSGLRPSQRYSYNGYMEKATVSKLKDNLSAYLRKVRAGHAVVIYDRDVPIARLERIESSGRSADRLTLLRAQGIARPPLRARSAASVRSSLSNPVPRSARVLDAMQEDRTEDR
jgi:antitoxin (DNA-binding transcriptional repressor) of toxin-antitoxin stability system